MSLTGFALVLALVLLVVAFAFQAALALGVPWGAMAYGGRVADADGTLPGRYRVSSVVTLVVLAVAAWSAWADVAPVLWVFAALFAVNTVANLAGRHPVERWGMGAVTLGLVLCCVTLALG